MHATSKAAAGILVTIFASTSCSEGPPTVPDSRVSTSVVQGRPIADVLPSQMTVPGTPRAWDTSETALIQELQRVGGVAFVAFKNPESPTAFSNGGLRLGMGSTEVARALDAISAAGGEILDFYPAVAAARMRITPAAAALLRRSLFVDFVEPLGEGIAEVTGASGTRAASVAAAPRAPMAQTTPWGITMIGAPTVWGQATGAGVRVMIMDYGVKSHRDLPSVPLNHCGGLLGACSPPEQYGTFEAGGFFALNNTLDVVGTAPGITSANIFTWRFCYVSGSSSLCNRSIQMNGFQAALDSGVKVIAVPISLRDYSAAEASWIAALWSNNIVVVAPLPIVSGTIPTPADSTYPAQLLNVVGVAGVKDDTTFANNSACGAYSSKYGPMVDLVAPFWGITTGNNNDLWTYCGNSHGVTHVAGVLALMRQKFPSYTASALVNKLFQSAIPRGPAGWDDHYGNGLVNAPGALSVPPPPFTMSIDGPRYVTAYSTCTWIAAASGGQPPYTYQWFLDGSPAGTEQSFTYTAGTTFFRLEVWVNDAASGSGSSRLTVDIDPNAEPCLM